MQSCGNTAKLLLVQTFVLTLSLLQFLYLMPNLPLYFLLFPLFPFPPPPPPLPLSVLLLSVSGKERSVSKGILVQS